MRDYRTELVVARLEVLPIERVIARPRTLPRINRGSWLAPALLVAALLSLLYLGQTSDVATTGYDIADLQAQKQSLQMENEQLRLKVAQLKSLDRVDREASARLDMGPPERVIHVEASPLSLPTPRAVPTTIGTSAGQHLGALWQIVVSAVSAIETVSTHVSRR